MPHQAYWPLRSKLPSYSSYFTIHYILLKYLCFYIFFYAMFLNLSFPSTHSSSGYRLLPNLFTLFLIFIFPYISLLTSHFCFMAHAPLVSCLGKRGQLLKLGNNYCLTTLTSSKVLSPILPPLFP